MGEGSPLAGCGCVIAVILLIAGGIMFNVCEDAVENNICGGNDRIEKAGLIMMIVGGSIIGVDVICCLCFLGICYSSGTN